MYMLSKFVGCGFVEGLVCHDVIMMLVCGACTLGGVDCSNYSLSVRCRKEVPLVRKSLLEL